MIMAFSLKRFRFLILLATVLCCGAAYSQNSLEEFAANESYNGFIGLWERVQDQANNDPATVIFVEILRREQSLAMRYLGFVKGTSTPEFPLVNGSGHENTLKPIGDRRVILFAGAEITLELSDTADTIRAKNMRLVRVNDARRMQIENAIRSQLGAAD